MKFKVLHGKHATGMDNSRDNPKVVYGKGEIIDTDLPLDQMFKNKFERVDLVPAPPEQPKPKKVKKVKKKVKKAKKGINSTEKFPVAVENGFEVYRRGAGYYVHREGSDEGPVHEKSLKKSAVEDFIEHFVLGL